ncbi:MAG: hypothetical protein WAN33_13025 [Candidatus Acidiferrales bacterium]
MDHYIEHADELAQRVMNFWGSSHQTLPADFMETFDKACCYQRARDLAANHRQFGSLTSAEGAEERETRIAFAKSYKARDDSAPAPGEGSAQYATITRQF